MSFGRPQVSGFRWVALGDLVVEGPTNGYSGPTGQDAKGSPTLRLSATTSGTLILAATTTKRLYKTIEPENNLWLQPGDLLVQRSNTRELVGTAALYDGPSDAYVYPDLMMRLRFKDHITARFVCRYMNSPAGRGFFSRIAAGSSGSMPKISGAKLRMMQIPLPPHSEQRRIGEVLDKADALRAKRRVALAQLDTLTQSIFLDMFGDPTTNPKGWPEQTLTELRAEFRYGTSNKAATSGKPALRIPNVVAGSIDVTELKLVPVTDDEFARLRLQDGDLLVVRTNGNPEFVGRCAVFTGREVASSKLPSDQFIFASYLIRVRIPSHAILPVFMREFLLGPQGRRQLLARSKTSAGQYNINTEGLGTISVIVPGIDQQRDFAEVVDVVERVKSIHRKDLTELDALFGSLQHRAFGGAL